LRAAATIEAMMANEIVKRLTMIDQFGTNFSKNALREHGPHKHKANDVFKIYGEANRVSHFSPNHESTAIVTPEETLALANQAENLMDRLKENVSVLDELTAEKERCISALNQTKNQIGTLEKKLIQMDQKIITEAKEFAKKEDETSLEINKTNKILQEKIAKKDRALQFNTSQGEKLAKTRKNLETQIFEEGLKKQTALNKQATLEKKQVFWRDAESSITSLGSRLFKKNLIKHYFEAPLRKQGKVAFYEFFKGRHGEKEVSEMLVKQLKIFLQKKAFAPKNAVTLQKEFQTALQNYLEKAEKEFIDNLSISERKKYTAKHSDRCGNMIIEGAIFATLCSFALIAATHHNNPELAESIYKLLNNFVDTSFALSPFIGLLIPVIMMLYAHRSVNVSVDIMTHKTSREITKKFLRENDFSNLFKECTKHDNTLVQQLNDEPDTSFPEAFKSAVKSISNSFVHSIKLSEMNLVDLQKKIGGLESNLKAMPVNSPLNDQMAELLSEIDTHDKALKKLMRQYEHATKARRSIVDNPATENTRTDINSELRAAYERQRQLQNDVDAAEAKVDVLSEHQQNLFNELRPLLQGVHKAFEQARDVSTTYRIEKHAHHRLLERHVGILPDELGHRITDGRFVNNASRLVCAPAYGQASSYSTVAHAVNALYEIMEVVDHLAVELTLSSTLKILVDHERTMGHIVSSGTAAHSSAGTNANLSEVELSWRKDRWVIQHVQLRDAGSSSRAAMPIYRISDARKSRVEFDEEPTAGAVQPPPSVRSRLRLATSS
jgi:hypothetical protein